MPFLDISCAIAPRNTERLTPWIWWCRPPNGADSLEFNTVLRGRWSVAVAIRLSRGCGRGARIERSGRRGFLLIRDMAAEVTS